MDILFARLEHTHNSYEFLYDQVDLSSNEEFFFYHSWLSFEDEFYLD